MDEYKFKPIGYLQSPFTFKNGTPRQATVCRQARGIITIDKSVFNNPEHSLQGLEEYTHIWIFFIFHKNNNSYTKAKVKPPRLNGAKVGLFSTRSPYRPNNIGLTLAKVESVTGASVTVSGIDILDGTPVIDLKPYIAQYDHPGYLLGNDNQELQTQDSLTTDGHEQASASTSQNNENKQVSNVCEQKCKTQQLDVPTSMGVLIKQQKYDSVDKTFDSDSACRAKKIKLLESEKDANVSSKFPEDFNMADGSGSLLGDKSTLNSFGHVSVCTNEGNVKQDDTADKSSTQQSDCLPTDTAVSSAASWIKSPPISSLNVCFTERAIDQLKLFTATSSDFRYRLKFMKTTKEVKEAILNILREDPRSVYRRTKCVDSLYYFTVDVVHVTCWFDVEGDGKVENTVEVVRVKPASDVEQCRESFMK